MEKMKPERLSMPPAETPEPKRKVKYRTAAFAQSGLIIEIVQLFRIQPEAQIQPFGGGLRDMVPAPSGIRAEGDGAARPLLDRASVTEAGVPGTDVVGEPTEPTGVTGFMRNPLMMAAASGCVGVADRDAPAGECGGGGGKTFSR